MKRTVAILLLALMGLPFTGGVALAADSQKVDCLFYQTFRERDPDDYVECVL